MTAAAPTTITTLKRRLNGIEYTTTLLLDLFEPAQVREA
jgi:hypothetical protein